ncbi:hypothetical protein Pelo_7014 [Pelomyxa schiedti]|nr:hypothetical protein Pelo_7014 [Pelomyxa schiedti]
MARSWEEVEARIAKINDAAEDVRTKLVRLTASTAEEIMPFLKAHIQSCSRKLDAVRQDEEKSFSLTFYDGCPAVVTLGNAATEMQREVLQQVTTSTFSNMESVDAMSLSLPQLKKVLFSWQSVPKNLQALDLNLLHIQLIKSWLFAHVDKYVSIFNDIEDIDFLSGIIVSKNNFDDIETALSPYFQSQTREFTMSLWRFAIVELWKLKHPEKPESQGIPHASALQSYSHIQLANNKYAETPSQFSCDQSPSLTQYCTDVELAKKIKSGRPEYSPLGPDLIGARLREKRRQEADGRPKSVLEQAAEERNYKRRRTKYRALNSHKTRRTPTEIARNFIDLHMKELIELAEEQHPVQLPAKRPRQDKPEPESSTSSTPASSHTSSAAQPPIHKQLSSVTIKQEVPQPVTVSNIPPPPSPKPQPPTPTHHHHHKHSHKHHSPKDKHHNATSPADHMHKSHTLSQHIHHHNHHTS